jgi:uncharacterized membrane protein YqjE
VEPALTIIAISLWLIVFLVLTCVVYSLVSMWKENRFGWPLRGVIWFTVAIIGSCAVIEPSRRIRTDGQIVRKSLPSLAAMSVRDLLTFNLFLQFTDGLVSYQAFALGAAEANPVVAAAIVNWGMIWGLIYNKALACLLLLLIFALRRSQRLLAMQGLTVTASVYVCAIIVCLWELLR